MPTERADKTAIDYVLILLTPALIMLLVGSLIFFLIEVLYVGEYKDRLRWAFAFYVFGAVLVARISMMADIASRAPIYGLILAVLASVSLSVYVKYDGQSALGPFVWLINAILIGIVWWSTHRLTWDCTYIDREGEDAGTGLLEAAGLESRSERVEDRIASDSAATRGKGGLIVWWERYQNHREKQKLTRPLGVWVVYFALASLPIFGLGQALLAPDDGGRRRTVFWLMAIYVASGLALLLTTCFLSLRRYLRQRNVEMPVRMTTTWLATGALIIFGLVTAGALLPRPAAEYSLLHLTPTRSEREANRSSPTKDSAGKDQGQPGGSKEGEKDGANGKDRGNKDGQNTGKMQEKDKSTGNDRGTKDSGGQKDKDGKSGKSDQKDKDGSGDKKDRGNDDSKSSSQNEPSNSSNNPLERLSAVLKPLATILKWLVFAAVALLVLFLVFRHGLTFLANFTGWAADLLASWQRFWAGLLGQPTPSHARRETDAEEAAAIEEDLPFAAFRNPFAEGAVDQRSARELLRYTFAALEAWARSRDQARLPHETPLEFATRIAGETPAVADELRRFIAQYLRAEYARSGASANVPEVVRQIWQRLEAEAEQAVSR